MEDGTVTSKNHIFIGYTSIVHQCSVLYQLVIYFAPRLLSKEVDYFLKNYSYKHGTSLKDQERIFTLGVLSFKYPQINWFLSHLSSSNNTDLLFGSIKKGKSLAVSDGSFFSIRRGGFMCMDYCNSRW